MNAGCVELGETRRSLELETSTSDELTVTETDAASSGAWDAYVAASPRAEIYHDYRWRSLIETVFGRECHYLRACDRNDRVRAVLPLVRLKSALFGDFLVSVPYFNYGGVLADSTAARDAMIAAGVKLGRKLGVRHIELRGRAGDSLDLPVRTDKVSMVLELPATEDELFKGFTSKLRAQIRRPGKAGATSRLGGAELLTDFYRVFSRNMRDLGTPVYSPRFFEAILATFPQQARVCVVDLDGRPVAAALVLSHRNRLEIPWASSLREANPQGVNMLLYWSVLRFAIATGCRAFDFGRSSKDAGTYRFKEQWGAVPQQLLWHYWLPDGVEMPRITPDNPKYRLAIAAWQRLPVPVANTLGPYIAKNLP
jgi:FemAB-related protein (PEP-CTERM system-associated)